jgi:hypothetical protein
MVGLGTRCGEPAVRTIDCASTRMLHSLRIEIQGVAQYAMEFMDPASVYLEDNRIRVEAELDSAIATEDEAPVELRSMRQAEAWRAGKSPAPRRAAPRAAVSVFWEAQAAVSVFWEA